MKPVLSTHEGAPRPRGQARLAWVVAIAFVLLAATVAYVVGRASRFEPRLPAMSTERVEVTPSPNVLLAVHELHRLEGASYHMERVIELTDAQTKLFGLIDAKDTILLVAVGDVVAGVDLDAMGESDLEVDWPKRRARLRLPAPRVLSTTIDNAKTHVYARSTDTLASRKEELEGLARQEAQSSMEKAALDAQILDRARNGVERALQGLVRGLGFTDVVVEWRAP